ncbi:MAG: YdcF family protein [Spirochaetia bacterium]|nr:YdcF family protein [Spirochaetia bacterium]
MKLKKIQILKWVIFTALSTASGIGIVFYISIYISDYSKQYLYSEIKDLPENRVGLVPGTAKYLKDGRNNRFYKYRIDAVVYLYQNRKIQYILVSGDNSTKYYNEPREIKNDLLKRGIPEKKIYLDYAGFRTLDTVIRARDVFQLKQYTFISQPFHNERAIFIGRNHGINIVGYNARDVNRFDGYKTRIREYFARAKAFLDVFILQTSPKFGGDQIQIK